MKNEKTIREENGSWAWQDIQKVVICGKLGRNFLSNQIEKNVDLELTIHENSPDIPWMIDTKGCKIQNKTQLKPKKHLDITASI